MTPKQEEALRDYLQEAIVPLIEEVLVKKLGQAMTFAKKALAEQPAQQDSTCSNALRAQGKAYPRTCKKCGLGPCVELAQQALDKKAENARELGLDYEPYKGISEHMTQATNGRVRIDPVTGDVGIGTPPTQPAVPDAFGTREGEHPQYIQGWNDCRAEMLRGKP